MLYSHDKRLTLRIIIFKPIAAEFIHLAGTDVVRRMQALIRHNNFAIADLAVLLHCLTSRLSVIS